MDTDSNSETHSAAAPSDPASDVPLPERGDEPTPPDADEPHGAVSSDKPDKNAKKRKKKTASQWLWPLKAFLLTLVLSAVFSLASESLSTYGGMIAIIAVIVVLIAISILFDMIGVAVASCDPTPFYSAASRKIRGAKTSLALIKRADVVSNVCNDVIGDICGIMSGGAGAGLALHFAVEGGWSLLVSIAVGSIISALTVGGKALCKRIALKHGQGIVATVGKLLSVFSKNK